MDLSKFDLEKIIIKELTVLVEKGGIGYIDAILHYSERSGIEIEVIAAAIKRNELIKSHLEIEAESLNMLKNKVARLPL